ncbi:CD209 antigen-like protein C [Hoplias malabaricus]|uniref:CD209 antigen-like protein C n=1 Tax=Hoplias malabaricus TaxID=27720 RepID=UPI0034628D7E
MTGSRMIVLRHGRSGAYPEALVARQEQVVRARARCFRLAAVCLGLLCVLLLITNIVFYVKYINLEEEKNSMSKNTFSLRENFKVERKTFLSYITNLTEERDGLNNSYQNLTEEVDQLKSIYKNMVKERDELKSSFQNLKCMSFGSSNYYLFNNKKSWSEARQECRNKGADLLIISSKEEQEFFKKQDVHAWLGLTDAEEEGEWKWVNGSLMTTTFWKGGEPNNANQGEDCAVFTPSTDPLNTWNDMPCTESEKWICELTAVP